MLEKIKATSSYVLEKTKFETEVGIILGTGLGGLVKEIDIGDADHVEPCIQALAFATAEELLLRSPGKPVAEFVQPELDEFGIHALATIFHRQMGTAHGN